MALDGYWWPRQDLDCCGADIRDNVDKPISHSLYHIFDHLENLALCMIKAIEPHSNAVSGLFNCYWSDVLLQMCVNALL